MTTVMDQSAIDRAERIKQNIHRNGSSSEIDTGVIMKEWQDSCAKIREALYGLRKPWDKRRPAEDELDNILFIIETAFSFGWGDTPNELECRLCESGEKSHMESCEKVMLWNYPEFARIICERAKNLNITTQTLIAKSLGLLKDGRGNVRQKVLEQLFGEEYYISGLRKFINAPEEQRSRIKESKIVKQRKNEEEKKFVEIAGRKNI